MRTKEIIVAALSCIPLLTSPALGHGVVGQRTFLEPFVTEDANPKNELIIAKPGYFNSREGDGFSLGFALEKKLADSVSLALEGEWLDLSPQEEPDANGFENLGILLKYASVKNQRHEFILSFGLEVEVPSGSQNVGAERDASVAPLMLFGKGLGDLPRGLWPLRPIAIMGDAGLEIVLSKEAKGEVLVYDLLLMYSIPYLESHVRDFGIPPLLDDLVPLVEFNFETVISGSERQTEAVITPGLVYLSKYVQLGIVARFPLNDTTNRELDWGVIGIIDIFYDDIFPGVSRWRLIDHLGI